jgi:preprotein translocase subunit YajC
MNSILLQTQPGSSMTMQLLFMGAIIAVFYFFMIRPQQKKAKDAKKFTEEIKRGDYVVTIGGVHGRIVEIEDDTFIIEIERGGRIKFSKSAVSMESSKAASKKAV